MLSIEIECLHRIQGTAIPRSRRQQLWNDKDLRSAPQTWSLYCTSCEIAIIGVRFSGYSRSTDARTTIVSVFAPATDDCCDEDPPLARDKLPHVTGLTS